MDLENLVYSLPSTQAFVQSAIDVAVGGAKIVLQPDNVSREMVGRLIRNQAESSNLRVDRIFDSSDMIPVTAAANAMNVSWPSPRTLRTVDNLLKCDNLPDILYVHRIGSARPWTDFIVNWAEEHRKLRKSGTSNTPSLCVIAKLRDFDFKLPKEDPNVSILWWWGFPSSLEIRLACRIADYQQNDVEPLVVRWREYVLPGIVGNDVQLGEFMWDFVTRDRSTVVESLADYWVFLEDAEVSGPIDDILEIVNANRADFTVGQGLPTDLWQLWATGAIVYTPEYGLELHPAFLAHCGVRSTVDHILWRGQSELLLPFINDIRLAICQDLTTSFGNRWPVKWIPPRSEHELQEVNRSPLSAEIGHINYLLQNLGYNSRHDLYPKRVFGNLTSIAMRVRNEIAHYDPVSYRDYVELCEERISVGV